MFVNENGAVVLGNWISPKRIVVPAWNNDVGTFNGGTINWSDGSVWTQSSAGALPVVMIIYVNPANGRPALAVQNGTGTVAFFNEFGDVVLGVMTDATHATVAAWGNDVPPVVLVVYPGAYHVFYYPHLRPGTTLFGHWLEYNGAAADDSTQRLHRFLDRYLK